MYSTNFRSDGSVEYSALPQDGEPGDLHATVRPNSNSRKNRLLLPCLLLMLMIAGTAAVLVPLAMQYGWVTFHAKTIIESHAGVDEEATAGSVVPSIATSVTSSSTEQSTVPSTSKTSKMTASTESPVKKKSTTAKPEVSTSGGKQENNETSESEPGKGGQSDNNGTSAGQMENGTSGGQLENNGTSGGQLENNGTSGGQLENNGTSGGDLETNRTDTDKQVTGTTATENSGKTNGSEVDETGGLNNTDTADSFYNEWLNNHEDDLVPMVVGVMLGGTLLLVLVCYIVSKRKRRDRRKTIGKMITDLQAGDKVVLLNSEEEED